MKLDDWLSQRSQSCPDRAALVADGSEVTYAELEAEATWVARRLAAYGVRRDTTAALTMQARAERHVARMAGITDKVLPHLETMEPGEILDSARNLERFDFVARRNYGLENQPPPGGVLNLAILTNRAAFQVIFESGLARPHRGCRLGG